MGLAVIQISARIFRKERFRYGEAKILNPSGVKKPSGHVDDKPKQKVIRKSLFNRS